jgi:type 1 fimbria pilin
MKNLFVALFIAFLSNGAKAAVTCSTNAGPFTVMLPSTVTLPSAPTVGTLLTTWVTTGSATTYSCNSSAIYWGAVATGANTGRQYSEGALTYTVYATGTPGIGIVIRADSSTMSFPLTQTTQHIDGNNGNTQLGTKVEVALIATGAIAPTNTISSQLVAQTYIDIGGGTYQYPINYSIPAISVKLQNPTCTVATPSIAVPLGNIGQRAFSGIGSTSPSQAFNIQLHCSGGASGLTTTVYTTLTDQTNTANVSGTLALTASSTATGIGIQILSNMNVISYGPDSNVIGNKNQLQAGQTQSGPSSSIFTIPLTARYVQTGNNVTAGTANGQATFTMSYQ